MAGISFLLSPKTVLSQKKNFKMKRIRLLYLLVIALSAGCSEKKTDSISLNGEIKGLGNDTIYIYGTDKMHDRMDTLVPVNGKFAATLSADTSVITMLLFKDGTEYPLFLDKGDKIQIKGSAAELSALQISGSTPNDELTGFNQGLKGLGTPSEKMLEEKAEEFITQHPASLASIYLLDRYFVQKPRPDLELIQKLAEGMTGTLRDRPYMEALSKRLDEEEKASTGKSAPYFRLRNAEGKEITRADFKDRYVLMQFWASWDTVSRAENSMFRRIYKKEQKNKNFAILGISLDLDEKEWRKAVGQDTLKWEQTCEYAGWNGEAVRQFAVHTLPANILISPNGRIEGRNLDEKAIEEKLEEIARKEKEKKEAERRKRK